MDILGARVLDIVTLFSGIATARTTWMTGCVRYCIEGTDKDGQPKEFWTDEARVQVLELNVFVPQVHTGHTPANPAGPRNDPALPRGA